MSGIPKLRGHHLICLHFFNGRGYNREFVENLKNILKRTSELGMEISLGADDICRSCPHLRGGKCSSDENSNDEIVEMDQFALGLLKKAPGAKTKWHGIKEIIPEIFNFWLERYCKKCSWKDVCEEDPLYREFKYGKDRR